MMNISMRKLFILSSSLIATNLYAGSCCGGGAGSAELMLGDTKSVVRTIYSDQSILADSSNDLKINNREDDEIESIRTLSLSSSYRLNELTQFGFNLPIIEKIKKVNDNWESNAGIGDLQLNMGYEFMPEYNRNRFISQGFIFSQITLPTAPSLFTTKRTDSLDTRGTGHYSYGIGTIFTKRQKTGMTTVQFLLSYRPGRKFNSTIFSSDSITTEDSFDNEVSISQSYSATENFAMSAGLKRSYLSNKTTSVYIGERQSSQKQTINLGLDYSQEDYTYLMSYSDDFLFNSSYNHVLGKSVSIGLIKRVSL